MRNTVYCYHDKRYKLKETGTYNVKLCVSINGERNTVSTNIYLTKTDWERINKKSLKEINLTIKRDAIRDIEKKARTILSRLYNPSIEDFLFEYNNEISENPDDHSNDQVKSPLVSLWFQKCMANKKEMGHPYAYYVHFATTLNSLLAFKKNLNFSHLTPVFLAKYRNWYESKGNSASGCD